MFFKRTDNLPQNLTSFDFIKFFAVLIMFADHIGAFFYPDELWWRVVGRFGLPVWFFLAGYSKSLSVGSSLWVGAAILVGANILLGQNLLPFNALATVILIRLVVPKLCEFSFKNRERLLFVFLTLFFLGFPTNNIFEYGTFAFLLAMFGYAIRHREQAEVKRFYKIFCLAVAIFVSAGQIVQFDFSTLQSIVCLLGLFTTYFILYHSGKPIEYPKVTAFIPAIPCSIVRFFGRYTLEIYIIHLVIIKIILISFHGDIYHFLSPTLFMQPLS